MTEQSLTLPTSIIQPITQQEEWAAFYGYITFENVADDKKGFIKQWMNSHTDGKMGKNEAYSKWRNKYMAFDKEKGVWNRKWEKWNFNESKQIYEPNL